VPFGLGDGGQRARGLGRLPLELVQQPGAVVEQLVEGRQFLFGHLDLRSLAHG
jgi:hypothetical protein